MPILRQLAPIYNQALEPAASLLASGWALTRSWLAEAHDNNAEPKLSSYSVRP